MRRFVITLFAAAAVVSTAHAQQKSLITGFDAMSSTVMQEGQSSFSGVGLRARIHPEQLVAGIEIMPSIEYWRNATTVSVYDIHTTRKDATLAIDARYNFKAKSWNPYLGAGWGLHFLSSGVDAPSLGLNDATDSVTLGGLSALAGTSFVLSSRVDSFIEFKYHHIPDYRQLKLSWGLAFNL